MAKKTEKSTKESKAITTDKPLTQLGRETLISYQQRRFASKMIGEPEELIPFAWRNPLKPESLKVKPNKVLRAMLENKEKQGQQ